MSIGSQSNFSLANFKSEVLGKGLARVNRFEVVMPRPKLLNQRTEQRGQNGAIVGGERIATSTPYQRPVVSDYGGDGLPMTFHLDRAMSVKRFFEDWGRFIINRDTFNVAFQEQYIVDIEIYQLDEFNNRTYGIKILEAFPRSQNQIELNHGAVGQTHRLIVLFSYRKWMYIDDTGPRTTQCKYQLLKNLL